MATILCVDADPTVLLILRTALERTGHRCIAVNNVDAALKVTARGPVDLIIAADRMAAGSGMQLIERLTAAGHDVPVVVATGPGGGEQAMAAVRAGALDYITKPMRAEQLAVVVKRALDLDRLRRENGALRLELNQLRGTGCLIGAGPAFQRVLELIRTVAPARTPVLLQGQSGTGKELLARAIHDASDRSGGPFVTIHCGALPEAIDAATLFANGRGPAGGVVRQVRSAFERAHGGTLVLDEVCELRLDVQAALLRALQEQEAERGSGTGTRADVRVVATTTRDLSEEARQGRFREDLFYSLNGVPVHVPPLRERVEDIPLLARHFATRVARDIGRDFAGIDAAALARLQAYPWPGNVRELMHAVERAVIISRGPTLTADAFQLAPPSAPGLALGTPDGAGGTAVITLRSLSIAEAEAALIERALAVTRNNRTRAAELLGISVRTLRNKLNREQPSAAD